MSLTMVTCVDMFFVEGNGSRQNIYGANVDAIRTTNRTFFNQIMRASNMIEELIMDSAPNTEVINLLDQIIMALTI
jgi:hypothetical protein